MSDLRGEAYPGCDVCEILDTNANEPSMILTHARDWIATLRANDQTLLGTTFITLRRHAYELDQLRLHEEQEFIVVRNGVIKAIRAAFQPVTFNVSCLKNDAFKKDPDAPADAAHVHWHIKPRYAGSVEFDGETFTDPSPGRYLNGDFERHDPGEETARAIAETIRRNMSA